MYTSSNATFPRANHHSPSPSPPDLTMAPSLPYPPPHLLISDHLAAAMDLSSAGGCHSSSASGCSGSPSTLASCGTQRSNFNQRSISSHSLQMNAFHCHFSSPFDFFDLDTSPVRRVFSAGDLHHGHKGESPISSESSVIIESMSKACKYSPEEKKERIARYRTKKSQRNFNKKIKYACRKTLADNRPRIRGRFARNDEIEKTSQLQWSNGSGDEDDDDYDNWVNFLDAFSAS